MVSQIQPYFQREGFALLLSDCMGAMQSMDEEQFDMIFADPPYFLSAGGVTCSGGKMVSVNKAEWDIARGASDMHEFNLAWLNECRRVLKPHGTIWVSGTMHNIYSIGVALQQLDYVLMNNITWFKPNAPPNLSCRYFVHSTETVLWAKKSKKAKHYFDYHAIREANGGKQMRDVWTIPYASAKEKKQGKFPTQKPLSLLSRIITASTKPGDIILDPFNGSGTTGIAAFRAGRGYVGIDNVSEYLDLTIRRLHDEPPLRV